MTTAPTSLHRLQVRGVLDRIAREQRRVDAEGEAHLMRLLDTGERPPTPEDLSHAYRHGYFATPPVVARLLYATVRALRPRVAVEFGTAHGFSTIHIAAALRDNGAGALLTSELDGRKVREARWNVGAAGLTDHVRVLHGEACRTLRTALDEVGQVDLVYLDGWAGSYPSVLDALEPALRPGALVLAHGTSTFAEDARPYLRRVRAPDSGFVSVEVPLGGGLEMSTRVR
jgi:predicted O-methyltransferase YrrM